MFGMDFIRALEEGAWRNIFKHTEGTNYYTPVLLLKSTHTECNEKDSFFMYTVKLRYAITNYHNTQPKTYPFVVFQSHAISKLMTAKGRIKSITMLHANFRSKL